jgi:hypothetical protein
MLTVSRHAHERLQERFGWPGTADDAARALARLEPVQLALAIARDMRAAWFLTLPDMGVELRFHGRTLMTVIDFDGRRAAPMPRRRMATSGRRVARRGGPRDE